MPPDPVAGTLSGDSARPFHLPNPLGLRFSERKLLLGLGDLVLLLLAFACALQLRAGSETARAAEPPRPAWFAVLAGVWFACALVIGCYDLVRAASIRRSLSHTIAALAATWAVYLLIPFVTPTLPGSRSHVLLFPLLALALIGLWRVAYAIVFAHPNFEQRALIIGAGQAGRTLACTVAETGRQHRKYSRRGTSADGDGQNSVSGIGYHVLGFIDDSVALHTVIEGVPVVGTRHDLPRLLNRLQVNELVVAITHLETMNAELFEMIQQCRMWGLSITSMTDLYERMTGRVPIEHAGRSLAVAMPVVPRPTYRFYLIAQRAVDIVGALLGCVLLLLAMPLVWLANRLSAPGPLFYTQQRVGRAGLPFQIVKFRSMRVDAEKFSGAVWAEENDPRITPVGRLLRKTRLDEIPQFLNILRGEMSLIGPRPERPHFVDQLTVEIPFYRVRHAVKPGLTGWAQVKYRYGASVEDALIKLQHDLFYIKHQSLLLDVEIVFKTIPIILGFKGR